MGIITVFKQRMVQSGAANGDLNNYNFFDEFVGNKTRCILTMETYRSQAWAESEEILNYLSYFSACTEIMLNYVIPEDFTLQPLRFHYVLLVFTETPNRIPRIQHGLTCYIKTLNNQIMKKIVKVPKQAPQKPKNTQQKPPNAQDKSAQRSSVRFLIPERNLDVETGLAHILSNLLLESEPSEVQPQTTVGEIREQQILPVVEAVNQIPDVQPPASHPEHDVIHQAQNDIEHNLAGLNLSMPELIENNAIQSINQVGELATQNREPQVAVVEQEPAILQSIPPEVQAEQNPTSPTHRRRRRRFGSPVNIRRPRTRDPPQPEVFVNQPNGQVPQEVEQPIEQALSSEHQPALELGIQPELLVPVEIANIEPTPTVRPELNNSVLPLEMQPGPSLPVEISNVEPTVLPEPNELTGIEVPNVPNNLNSMEQQMRGASVHRMSSSIEIYRRSMGISFTTPAIPRQGDASLGRISQLSEDMYAQQEFAPPKRLIEHDLCEIINQVLEKFDTGGSLRLENGKLTGEQMAVLSQLNSQGRIETITGEDGNVIGFKLVHHAYGKAQEDLKTQELLILPSLNLQFDTSDEEKQSDEAQSNQENEMDAE